jgi:hypothetical protein
MILSTSPGVGKSDTLVDLANDLSAFLRRGVRDGLSFDEVERGILEKVLDMGFAAANLFLEAQGDGDLGASVETEDGTILYRSASVAQRPLRTIFGVHSFEAYVYSPGCNRKIELRPIDARLNLPEGKASYLLQEFSQLFCVEKAFAVGARQFETVFRQQLSVDVLEDINRAMGTQAERFLEHMPTPPRAEEGVILVTTADNKGVPLVREDAEKIPVFEQKERPGNRRMATLGCVYTVDRHMRTPEQIVAALFRDDTVPQPATRPQACHKRYRAYFADPGQDGEDAVPSAYRTWTWLADEANARGHPGQPIVRVMDAQQSLWDASDICLEDLVAKRQAAGETPLVDILDIVHVSGYVWKAAKAFYGHKEQQEAFVQDRLLRILRGEVCGVIRGMRRMASQHGLKGPACKDVTTTCNYFENNAHRMRYDEYLKAGYPIASGVIEGACRHVIKDRMEHGGMRWTLEGAQAMLDVRCVSASSEWDNFGQWRQTEEAKRVHPHRALVANYQGFNVWALLPSVWVVLGRFFRFRGACRSTP